MNESLIQHILNNICYTDLVFNRINKKLNTTYTHEQIKFLVENILADPNSTNTKIGKNFYITNIKLNIRLTINSNTFRVITADKIK